MYSTKSIQEKKYNLYGLQFIKKKKKKKNFPKELKLI